MTDRLDEHGDPVDVATEGLRQYLEKLGSGHYMRAERYEREWHVHVCRYKPPAFHFEILAHGHHKDLLEAIALCMNDAQSRVCADAVLEGDDG